MAVTEQRIFRARDGRPVPEGHEDAAVLAYAPGDEVPDVVLEQLAAEVAGVVAAEVKQAKAPANKAVKA